MMYDLGRTRRVLGDYLCQYTQYSLRWCPHGLWLMKYVALRPRLYSESTWRLLVPVHPVLCYAGRPWLVLAHTGEYLSSTGSPTQLTVPEVPAPHLRSSTVTPPPVFATETYEKYVSVPGTFYAGLQHLLLSAVSTWYATGLWHPPALLPVGPYSLPRSTTRCANL